MHARANSSASPNWTIAALVGSQCAIASLSIVGKITLGAVPPVAMVALRLWGSALVLLAIAACTRVPILPPPRALPPMVVLALSGLVINQLCFTAGLDRTNAINATIIVATIPVLTAAYAVLSGREHGSAKLWIGLGAALLGAILVADPRRLALSGGHLQGNLLLLANSALYSVFLVEARAWIGRYGPQCVLVWVFAIGAVFITPIGIPAVAAHAASWDLRLWIAIAYIVLFATAFAYAANTWALRHLPSSFVALFIYAQPLLAIAMAVSLGESLAQWLRLPASTESITANTMIGTAAIFFGIYIATRTNRSRRELDHAT